MAKCEICNKSIQTGHRLSINRSRVDRRANRIWKPNLKKVHLKEDGKNLRTVYMCVACLRNKKHGKSV